MSTENPMYPFYIGDNPPSNFVGLGGNVYILKSDGTTIFATNENRSGYTKLTPSSNWYVKDTVIIKIDTSNFDTSYVTTYRDDFLSYKYPSGRLLKDGNYSCGVYFDRTGLNNELDIEQELLRVPGKPKYVNFGTNDPNNIYLLMNSLSQQFCCKNNNLGDECGVGRRAINTKNSDCIEYGRQNCNTGSPKAFFGQYCQREYCKTSPKSINPGNCDNDYKALCNIKQDLNVSAEKYPYYKKYPDYCSCFMEKDFLNDMCTSYIDKLGIKRNIKAQNALEYNTQDPNQCNMACKVHPLCKLGAQVPYDMPRGDNPIVLGAKFPDECKSIELCVQDVTVNSTGDNIGKLSINQTANCKTTLQKVCAKSTFSPCTGAKIDSKGKKYTYNKTLLVDNDEGACADPGTDFVCAEFNIPTATDVKGFVCDNKTEKVNFSIYNSYTDGFEPEVLSAANHFINDLGILDSKLLSSNSIKTFKGGKLTFDPVNSIVNGQLDCKNCVLGYTGPNTCKLTDNKKWIQTQTLTNVVTPSSGGGLACQKDSSNLIQIDCPLLNDCIVINDGKDTSCIDGNFNYKFKIKSLNSGGGMSCSESIMKLLPAEVKSKNPQINIDYKNLSGVASINCNDCVIDYMADESKADGKCHLNKDNKYTITKYATLLKPASNGGVCDTNKLKEVTDKKYIEEECTFNQNCTFKEEPLSDECDDKIGIRTIKYARDVLNSGNGKGCIDVANDDLGKRYTPLIDLQYSDSDKKLTIKTSCEISTDCLLQLRGGSCDKKTGVREIIYDITSPAGGNGKSCEDVAREFSKSSGEVVKKGKTVVVKETCEKVIDNTADIEADKKKWSIISIIVFILIILLAVFLL